MAADARRLKRGFFFVFEGIDGCGKTTQLALLRKSLESDGYPVEALREPTAGPFGLEIRRITEKTRDAMTPEEELRLFMEDRRLNVRDNILPALAAGSVILLDRYYLSSAAYQGARGLDPVEIIRQNELFAPRPDVFFLLLAPVRTGLSRIEASRPSADPLFEKETYLAKVAAIFSSIHHDAVFRLDATEAIGAVSQRIRAKVLSVLEG